MEEKEKKSINYWIKELLLYSADKQVLLNGEWLTDSIISAAQQLLKKDFPHIGGLQPTILSTKYLFDVQRCEFIQILHVYGSHWLTISNIGCPAGSINVYDSLPNCALYSNMKRQIATILFLADQKMITVNFVDVQIQGNGSDCGVYALAFVTSLCCGEDPAKINYASPMSREHLYKCLENQKMTSFPQRSRGKKARCRNQTSFEIFCKCRNPEYGKMICCNSCREWYHEDCITAPPAVWKNINIQWFCDNC